MAAARTRLRSARRDAKLIRIGEVDILAAFVGGRGTLSRPRACRRRWRAVVELNLTSRVHRGQAFSPLFFLDAQRIGHGLDSGRLAGLSAPYSAQRPAW